MASADNDHLAQLAVMSLHNEYCLLDFFNAKPINHNNNELILMTRNPKQPRQLWLVWHLQ